MRSDAGKPLTSAEQRELVTLDRMDGPSFVRRMAFAVAVGALAGVAFAA